MHNKYVAVTPGIAAVQNIIINISTKYIKAPQAVQLMSKAQATCMTSPHTNSCIKFCQASAAALAMGHVVLLLCCFAKWSVITVITARHWTCRCP